MAASLVARYSPRSVVDVGCGTGGLLAELRRQGVPVLKGFEYHDEGRAMCRRHGLDVEYGDLSQPLAIPSGFDLCVCLEVAEHLPAGAAQQLVANLAAGPPTLIFSAATPGQGGHAHLNEQPAKYWVDKLAGAGMVRSEQETRDLSENWTASGVAIWFSKNVQVFRRA